MTEATMESVFKSDIPRRDKFLSRVFGIFSEDVVRHWCADARSQYNDLGRPTVRATPDERGHTLDFTFQEPTSGRTFVGELKCELEFEGYRYLRLTSPRQLDHHSGHAGAFRKFLKMATSPGALETKVGGKPVPTDGAILVWGAVNPVGAAATAAEYGFADVLSVEAMIADLSSWHSDAWASRVDELRIWTLELFEFLGGPR